jgi:hypothetical protein
MREHQILARASVIATYGSEYSGKVPLTEEENKICEEALLRVGIPNLPSGGMPNRPLTFSQNALLKATIHNLVVESQRPPVKQKVEEKDVTQIQNAKSILEQSEAVQSLTNLFPHEYPNPHSTYEASMEIANTIFETWEKVCSFTEEYKQKVDILILDLYSFIYKDLFEKVTKSEYTYNIYKHKQTCGGCEICYRESHLGIPNMISNMLYEKILRILSKDDDVVFWKISSEPCFSSRRIEKCWKLFAIKKYIQQEIGKELKQFEENVLSNLTKTNQ